MTTNAAQIVPAKTALMLMDFQPAILASLGDAEELLAHAHAALEWARSENVRVVYVRVAFTAEDYTMIPTHNAGLRGGGRQQDACRRHPPRPRSTSHSRSAKATPWCARPGSEPSAQPTSTRISTPKASTP